MAENPIVVSFRFDAASIEDAQAVIEAIQAAGITIIPHHTYRPKRRDAGVFWDGQIAVPGGNGPVKGSASTARELPESRSRNRIAGRGQVRGRG